MLTVLVLVVTIVVAAAAAAAKSLQSCPTLCDPIDTRLPRPWDSPGKNTGVGCHFLLQCMKVNSESEVAQSCPTPSDPIDGSPPGSPIPGSGCLFSSCGVRASHCGGFCCCRAQALGHVDLAAASLGL